MPHTSPKKRSRRNRRKARKSAFANTTNHGRRSEPTPYVGTKTSSAAPDQLVINKDEVEAVSESVATQTRLSSDTQRPKRFRWVKLAGGALGGVAALIGFFADVGGFYSKWLNRQPLHLGLAWYEKKENSLQLVPLNAVKVELKPEDVLNKRVSIPVNLAIANKEAHPLEVVRVELSYDKNLRVESRGKAKIDPSNDRLIYEHHIGTLENVSHYTPLETIDFVYVPFMFHVVPVIARSKDGVPLYLVTIVGYEGEKFADKVVELGVNIYCKDRPPVNGIIRFHLRAAVQLIGLGEGQPTIVDVTKEDIALFQTTPARSELLANWERRDTEEGFVVHYSKIKHKGGVYQYISIDGTRRRLNADIDADGLTDYEMFDSSGDGLPEKKVIASNKEPMLDWTEDGLR